MKINQQFWQKSWVQKILVIVFLTSLNILGAIFFGWGFFAILFLSGFLSLFLYEDGSRGSFVGPSLTVLVATMIICYLVLPLQFRDNLSKVLTLITYGLVVICYSLGLAIALISSYFCHKNEMRSST